MADSQDAYDVVGDSISNDVRVYDREFAQSSARHETAAIRKAHQTVTCREQLRAARQHAD
jgi:hypothetical protein